jgi:hypothetical protein
MRNALGFIGQSYLAGLIILALFILILAVLLFVGWRNAKVMPEDFNPSDSRDMRILKAELMKKDAERKEAKRKVMEWQGVEAKQLDIQK